MPMEPDECPMYTFPGSITARVQTLRRALWLWASAINLAGRGYANPSVLVHSSRRRSRPYGRGDVAAVARVLVSMLVISRRAIAAGITAFMIWLTWPGMMTDRQMRTCWQALYQSNPPRFSAQEKRARKRLRCGSAGPERLWTGFWPDP